MCPFVEATDRRCGRYLTLDALAHALEHCACDYQQCPVYREIQRDARHSDEPARQHFLVAG